MKGVLFSIASSALFGLVYYLASQLAPLSALELLGWRITLIGICLAIFMFLKKDWWEVREIVQRTKYDKRLFVALPLSGALMGVQMWLFVWSPSNNEALNTSLGFFLLPLSMVVAGRVFFKEHLNFFQKVACLLALLGVVNQMYHVASFSWTTALSGFGLVPYFCLRRYMKIDNLGGLWFDTLFQMPFALSFIIFGKTGITGIYSYSHIMYILPFFGISSALALICAIRASRLLPIGFFGLLSYLEPMLLMLVALTLGETIKEGEWLTYLCIWLAILSLLIDGIRHVRQHMLLQRAMKV